jgi:signal transduction histidine kinase
VSTASQTLPAVRDDQATNHRERLLLWLISSACAAVIAASVVMDFQFLRAGLGEMGIWLPAFILVNMLPVTAWRHTPFVPDMPLLILAALVLRPSEIGLVAFVGAFDPRELKGEITLTRAAYNRSQLGFAALLGSAVANAMSNADAAGYVFLEAVLALAAIVLTNSLLVSLGVSIDRGYPFLSILRRMFVGHPWDYTLTHSIAALSASALALLYAHSQALALLGALAISLLARQALDRSQAAVDTSRAYRSREHALIQVSRQVQQERSDERKLIAAELHDEVLQPLFKVTLMAQVLKGDLAGGRLLELDQDLPELLTAAELASTTLRELIGDLRRSALGRGGLAPALLRFLQAAAERGSFELHTAIEAVEIPPDVELVFYQIAKEAASNAISHAKCSHIWVSLDGEGHEAHLEVSDDGTGFDTTSIPAGHYGIEIMAERAAAVGAWISIESSPGRGTRISLSSRGMLHTP